MSLWCQESRLGPKYHTLAPPNPRPASLTENEENFHRNLPANLFSVCCPEPGHLPILCESLWREGNHITGFDKSELNPQAGGVDTGKLSEVLQADDRGEMHLGQVGQP